MQITNCTQNYKDYFGVESSEDVKVTILKNELNKLK